MEKQKPKQTQKIKSIKHDILKYPQPEINFSPQIPLLKKIKNKSEIDLRYCLVQPYAYAHIYWNDKKHQLFYEVEEPILTEKEKEYKVQATDAIRSMIDF